jgi:hypothetical protein
MNWQKLPPNDAALLAYAKLDSGVDYYVVATFDGEGWRDCQTGKALIASPTHWCVIERN